MHLDVFHGLFLPVVPEAIVYPLSDELPGRLGTKRVLGGHVEIIHESQQLLPSNWNIHTYKRIFILCCRSGQKFCYILALKHYIHK